MLSSIFFSCQKDDRVFDMSQYTIVSGENAAEEISSAVSALSEILPGIKVATDSKKAADKELLIGNTNRYESESALKTLKRSHTEKAFIIKVINDQIVIIGNSDSDTAVGVKYFINEYASPEAQENGIFTITSDTVIIKTTGDLIGVSDEFNLLVRETLTDIIKEDEKLDSTAFGSIIKLEHSGDKNGILLSTHQSDYRKPYQIYVSKDDGKTWKKSGTLEDNLNARRAGYHAEFYELPEDMGNFKKGTLLLVASFTTEASVAISVSYSTDVGKSWTTVSDIVSQARINDNSFSVIYDDKTARFYCFYQVYSSHYERECIVYKYSSDLVNWSEAKYCVIPKKDKYITYIPSSPSIAKLGNGQYVLAYDLTERTEYSIPEPPVYIKFTDDLDSWNTADFGSMVKTQSGNRPLKMPSVAWTPSGGECGTLIVAASLMDKASVDNKCDWFVSFDYGQSFVTLPSPIPTANVSGNIGDNPGIFVDSEGSIYYLNNPRIVGGTRNIRFVFSKTEIY